MKTSRPVLSSFAILTVFLLCGSASGQNPLASYQGKDDGDRFGSTLSAAGDVDLDGCADYILGANYDSSGTVLSGRAEVRSGKTGALLFVLEADPALEYGGFAVAVAGGGDLDSDGVPDFVVGDNRMTDGPGSSAKLWVYSGKDGSKIREIEGVGKTVYPTSLAILGDVDADGLADILVGAPQKSVSAAPGHARVYSGKNGSLLYHFPAPKPNDWFGLSVAAAGDVDGDGAPDLLVGAAHDDTNGFYAGKVFVFSGKTGATIHEMLGEPGSNLGQSLDRAGDLNADGFSDILAGAPGTASVAGKVLVYSGKDASVLHEIAMQTPYNEFGSSVAGAGDLDEDGVGDILVGDPFEVSISGAGVGTVRVFSGADASLLFLKEGTYYVELFGSGVLGPGDLNGDGHADFLVASESAQPWDFQSPKDSTGKVSLFSGHCPGTTLSYGAGCTGSGGFLPTLVATGCPSSAEVVSLKIENALGFPATGIAFVGVNTAALALPNGCIFRVDPILASFPVAISHGLGFGVGSVVIDLVIPPSMPSGTILTLQAFVFDAGAPGGYSGTNGVQITIAN